MYFRLACPIIAAAFLCVALAPLSISFAQDALPYDAPIFTGPVHEIHSNPFDQEHIRLALRFEPDAGRIFGVAKIRIRPDSDSLRTLELSALDLDIYSVQVGALDSLKLETAYTNSEDGALQISLDSLQVHGVPFEVQITYAATPKRGMMFRGIAPEDTMTSVHVWTENNIDGHKHWLPMINNSADRVTSEIIATVPPSLMVMANGMLVEEMQTEDGKALYHYVQDQFHPPHDIGLVIGYFARKSQNVQLRNGFSVTLNQWLPARERDSFDLTFPEIPDMLHYFSDALDFTYPWPSYSQLVFDKKLIDDMSYTGFSVFNDRVLADERSRIDDPGTLRQATALARQWFSHQINTDHWADVWLTESLPLFMGLMYVRQAQGDEAYLMHLKELAFRYKEETRWYKRPLVWNQWENESDLIDAHARGKGVWIFHSLYSQLGEEAFWNVLKTFTSRFAFRTTNTDDLLAAFNSLEIQEDVFFDDWIYSAGHPSFNINYQYDLVSESLYVAVEQIQEGYLVPPVYNMDVTLETYTLSGPERRKVNLNKQDQLISIPMRIQPRYVLLDPDHTYLSDIQTQQSSSSFVTQLRYASNPLSQLAALKELESYAEDPALLIGLQSALSSRPIAAVRAGIVRLMAALPPSDAVQRSIIEAYDDESVLVRIAVLQSLESFENHADLTIMAMDAAQNAESYQLQAQAVMTLARIKAPSAKDIVQSALITPSHRDVIRRAALASLPHAGFSTQDQVKMVTDYSGPTHATEVRMAAIETLGYLAGLQNRRSMAVLKDLLDDPDPYVRGSVINELGRIGEADELELLEQRLDEESNPRLIRATKMAVKMIEDR